MTAKNKACTGHNSEIIHHLLSRCRQKEKQQNFECVTEKMETLNWLLEELDRKAKFVEDERLIITMMMMMMTTTTLTACQFAVSNRSYKRGKPL